MPPKPFPYPISIGVDISLISRMRRLLIERDGQNIIPLAKRILHRGSELGLFKKRLDTYREQAGDHSTSCGKRFDQSADCFARWVAGRWAAKEAVVKAHTFRRLLMSQITIDSHKAARGSGKPFAVIDPPREKIRLPVDIARENGYAIQVTPEAQALFGYTDQDVVSVLVGPRIREEDRRIAQISISHDGPNVVAVCMALDEDCQIEDTVTCDASGESLHNLGRRIEDYGVLQHYYKKPAATRERHAFAPQIVKSDDESGKDSTQEP